ncbi:60S ribosomal protein L27a-2 [Linum perenne]
MFFCPIVNIDKLWSMVPQEVKDKAAKDGSVAPMIDVTQFGYFKVLGKGVLPDNQPIGGVDVRRLSWKKKRRKKRYCFNFSKRLEYPSGYWVWNCSKLKILDADPLPIKRTQTIKNNLIILVESN